MVNGSRRPIITNYDILVAGPACVDFSTLNNNKPEVDTIKKLILKYLGLDNIDSYGTPEPATANKTFLSVLEMLADVDCGQSMNTFLSSLRILARDRPKLAIFENVQNAPWKQMVSFWFPLIGYTARSTLTDSKDFLVPQTRVRGYLVAVNSHIYGNEAISTAESWVKMMNMVKLPLTSTFQECLLLDDDPRLARIQSEVQSRGRPSRDTIAEQSVSRHEGLRNKHQMGHQNPYTLAQYAGGRLLAVTPPVRSWRGWIQSQAARIVDSLDIGYLWASQQGEDLRFKMRTGDLSQNADFQTPWFDTRAGVMPCITPSGIFWLTHLGRFMTGLEAIGLHGIPIDKLIHSGETNDQLQNAAGNTMTAPVVGSAILFALELAYKQDPHLFISSHQQHVAAERDAFLLPEAKLSAAYAHDDHSGFEHEHHLWPVKLYNTSNSSVMTLSDLLVLVRAGRRYCFCPQLVLRPGMEKEFVVCPSCGDSACRRCLGNPTHECVPKELASGSRYIGTVALKLRLQSLLPGRFHLNLADEAAALQTTFKTPESHLPVWEAIVEALTSQVFYLDTAIITETATVVYKSRHAYARAVFTDQGVTWYLLLSREFQSRADLKGLHDLSQPIAKVVFTDPDVFLPGTKRATERWSIWVPQLLGFNVFFTEVSPNKLLVSDVFPKDHDHEAVTATLRDQITGVYQRRPECGAADDSLLVKETTGETDKTFLFKEVTALGPREEDHYVFADTKRQLALHEYREAHLHVQPGDNEIIKTPPGDYSSILALQGYVTGYWSDIQTISCGPYAGASHDRLSVGNLDEFVRVGLTLPCTRDEPGTVLAAYTLPLLHLPLTAATMSPWAADWLAARGRTWYTVRPDELTTFLRRFAFAWAGHHLADALVSLARPQPIHGVGRCAPCVALPPLRRIVEYDSLHKTMGWDPKSKGPKTKPLDLKGVAKHKVTSITASFEDPIASEQYERALDSLPTAFEIQIRVNAPDDDKIQLPSGEEKMLKVDALHDGLAQIRFVCHPATLAHQAMASFLASSSLYAAEVFDEAAVRLSWTFSTAFRPAPQMHLQPFRDFLFHTGQDTTGLCDVVYDLETKRFDKTRHALYPEQRSAVQWMVQREMGPKPFIQREVGELCVPELGFRLTGIAQSEIQCRGGVVAHAVGFGKTVVCLALVDHMAARDKSTFGIDQLKPDRIALPATLVVCTHHISPQWKSEIHGFMGKDTKVVRIRHAADLLKTQENGEFEAAEFIIVHESLFTSDSYLTAQSRAFGLPTMPKTTDLAMFAEWYAQGYRHIPFMAQTYGHPDAAKEAEAGLLEEERQRMSELLRAKHIPSLEDQINQAAQLDPEVRKKLTVPRPKARGTGNFAFPLDFFAVRRVILDEASFSVEGSPLSMYLANVRAGAKWLLSGTPRLSNLEQLNISAQQLGIHLASPQPNVLPGLPAAAKGPRTDLMSPSATFRATRDVKSCDYVLERHEKGIEFVRHFYRCNTIPDGHFQQVAYVLTVDMTPEAYCAYADLTLQLALAGENFFGIPASVRTRLYRNEDDEDELSESSSAALVIRASAALGAVVPHSHDVPVDVGAYLQGTCALADHRMVSAQVALKRAVDRLMWVANVVEATKDGYRADAKLGAKFKESKARIAAFIGDILTADSEGRVAKYGGRDIWSSVIAAMISLPNDGPQPPIDTLLDWARWGGDPGQNIRDNDRSWSAAAWQKRNGGDGQFTAWDFYDLSPDDVHLRYMNILASELPF